jgi:hypothetical protein
MKSQLGTKPTRRTVTPTASHPARQPSPLDGDVRDQRQRHQARHLRQIGDRAGEGAARDEPAVQAP